MEEWQEKDHQQQSALLDKQEAINKLDELVDSLNQQLSAKANRYIQWEPFHICISVGEWRIGLCFEMDLHVILFFELVLVQFISGWRVSAELSSGKG